MPGQSRRARPQEGLTAGARPGARAFPLRGSDAGARSLHRRQRQGRQRLPRWQDRALELFSFRLHLFRTLEVPRRGTPWKAPIRNVVWDGPELLAGARVGSELGAADGS